MLRPDSIARHTQGRPRNTERAIEIKIANHGEFLVYLIHIALLSYHHRHLSNNVMQLFPPEFCAFYAFLSRSVDTIFVSVKGS
jgi:hypothetical protein